MNVTLFLRHKIIGENSIEELAIILCNVNSNLKLVIFRNPDKYLENFYRMSNPLEKLQVMLIIFFFIRFCYYTFCPRGGFNVA